MKMIFSEEYSLNNLSIKLKKQIGNNGYSIKQACSVLGLKNVMLAKILVDEMVKNGDLCIDESDFEIFYYNNTFLSN